MSFLLSNQSQPWITANLLELINPDINDWSCVGHAHSQGRRCRNRIARPDVVQAKRLLTALPSIANDTRVLERELARLASLTLCKRRHVEDPNQHIQVIQDWIASIRCTQGLESIALAQQRDQHIHRIRRREHVVHPRRIVEPARQPIASVPQPSYFVDGAATSALSRPVYQPNLQSEQHRHIVQPHRIQQPDRQLFAHALEATYYPQHSATQPLIPLDRQIDQRVRHTQSRPAMEPVREPVGAAQIVVHAVQTPNSTSHTRTPSSSSPHREQQSGAAQPQRVVTPVGEQNAATPEANHQTSQPQHAPEPDRQRTASAPEGCTICLDDIGSNGGRETLRCNHSFCAGCIQRWQAESPSCPLCRDNGLRFIPDPFQARQLMRALQGVQEALQASDDRVVEPSAATPERAVPALPQDIERHGDDRPAPEVEQPAATSATSATSDPAAAPPADVAAEPGVEHQQLSIERLEAAIEALSVNEQQPPTVEPLDAATEASNVPPQPPTLDPQNHRVTLATEQPTTPASDTPAAVPLPPTASELPNPTSNAQTTAPDLSSTSVPATPAPSAPTATQSLPHPIEPRDCGICLEILGESGATETLPCSHTFCSECISQWLQRSNRCPYRCDARPRAHNNHGARL